MTKTTTTATTSYTTDTTIENLEVTQTTITTTPSYIIDTTIENLGVATTMPTYTTTENLRVAKIKTLFSYLEVGIPIGCVVLAIALLSLGVLIDFRRHKNRHTALADKP